MVCFREPKSKQATPQAGHCTPLHSARSDLKHETCYEVLFDAVSCSLSSIPL